MAPPSLTTMTSDGGATRFQWHAQRSYYAEVPALSLDAQSRLIEGLIDLAFGTLGVRYLDVRVLAAAPEPARQPSALGCPVHSIARVSI